MTLPGFITDEHVPGPFIATLRSLGYPVTRSKDELNEGAPDRKVLSFAHDTDRLVITSDMRFTIIEGKRDTDHPGIIYADQGLLKSRPQDCSPWNRSNHYTDTERPTRG